MIKETIHLPLTYQEREKMITWLINDLRKGGHLEKRVDHRRPAYNKSKGI